MCGSSPPSHLFSLCRPLSQLRALMISGSRLSALAMASALPSSHSCFLSSVGRDASALTTCVRFFITAWMSAVVLSMDDTWLMLIADGAVEMRVVIKSMSPSRAAREKGVCPSLPSAIGSIFGLFRWSILVMSCIRPVRSSRSFDRSSLQMSSKNSCHTSVISSATLSSPRVSHMLTSRSVTGMRWVWLNRAHSTSSTRSMDKLGTLRKSFRNSTEPSYAAIAARFSSLTTAAKSMPWLSFVKSVRTSSSDPGRWSPFGTTSSSKAFTSPLVSSSHHFSTCFASNPAMSRAALTFALAMASSKSFICFMSASVGDPFWASRWWSSCSLRMLWTADRTPLAVDTDLATGFEGFVSPVFLVVGRVMVRDTGRFATTRAPPAGAAPVVDVRRRRLAAAGAPPAFDCVRFRFDEDGAVMLSAVGSGDAAPSSRLSTRS
mmetsp:Transcript_30732/g.94957  ORF Transcript_30732/g.94957 Transcript_30732/m.94957 type:complete len:434 (-) Transcript_30732:718-2019(-)